MPTAIEVEELAEARARLPAPTMAAAGLVLGDEAGGLQGLVHERVTEAHAVVPPGELMEVANVEALVAVAVEREHVLDLADRGAFGRGVCRRRSNSPS